MTTSYDTDPHAPTIAAAWASSSLGQPDTEVRHGFDATDVDEVVTDLDEPPTAKRVMVAAGIACAVAAGALTGVMLFYAGDSARPAVTVPAPDPRPAVLVGPSTVAPAPAPEQRAVTTAARPAPRVTQLPGLAEHDQHRHTSSRGPATRHHRRHRHSAAARQSGATGPRVAQTR